MSTGKLSRRSDSNARMCVNLDLILMIQFAKFVNIIHIKYVTLYDVLVVMGFGHFPLAQSKC